jgi:hypothetical protein
MRFRFSIALDGVPVEFCGSGKRFRKGWNADTTRPILIRLNREIAVFESDG